MEALKSAVRDFLRKQGSISKVGTLVMPQMMDSCVRRSALGDANS